MGKTYIETIKYLILANFKVKGIVKKPDIIGAVFGQSEGLLGPGLDIKELQQNGKIGRIDIKYTHSKSKNTTKGVLKLPCSVSMVQTAIIGASIESIDKVGPCNSDFKVKEIQDTRGLKRKKIKQRAISLLGRLMQDQIPDSKEMMDEIVDTFKTKEIINYGPDKLAAGPTVSTSKEIIIVEGRADVLNLLKYGFTNTISTGGARIPKSLTKICRNKKVVLFLDGDHGGDIQQSQLLNTIHVDYITRAPDGKEVEELTQKEINQALRKKRKAKYVLSKKSKKSNGIIKKTKYSVSSKHKAKPPKRDTKKYSQKYKQSSENDNFKNMLSGIPNTERVDISKKHSQHSHSSKSYNKKKNYNSKSKNTNSYSRKSLNKNKSLVKKAKKAAKTLSNEAKNSKHSSKKDTKKSKKSATKKRKSKTKKSKKTSSKKKSTTKKDNKDKVSLPKLTPKLKEKLTDIYKDLKSKKRTRILNKKLRRIASCRNSSLKKKIKNFKSDKIYAIVTTKEVNKDIINKATKKGTKIFVAKDVKDKIGNSKIHVLKLTNI